MRNSAIATPLAVLALLAGNAVQAEETSKSFKALDADANGYISEQEAAANPDLHARWKEIDGDKNNLLDVSEFSAFEAGSTGTPQEGGMMQPQDAPMGEGGTMEKGSGTPRY
jgi:hypothetical protein